VASPTFQLVRIYSGRVQLAHVDLYRLGADDEIRDVGLDELLDAGAVVVEWGERLAGARSALVSFEHLGGDRRLLTVERDLAH
jgi:tRNA A37 threonylcarbamoyladenosine biosynthesis protein TsaE